MNVWDAVAYVYDILPQRWWLISYCISGVEKVYCLQRKLNVTISYIFSSTRNLYFIQLPKFPSKYQNALEEISQPFNFPTYSSPLVVLTVGTRSYFILLLVLRMCQMTWLGSLYFKKKKNLHTFNLSPTVDTVNLLLWNSASPLLPFCAF